MKNDEQLKSDVEQELRWEPSVHAEQIGVSVKDGVALRANIDETVLPVIITEQGENRNQCEEQRDLFGFSYGLACRGT